MAQERAKSDETEESILSYEILDIQLARWAWKFPSCLRLRPLARDAWEPWVRDVSNDRYPDGRKREVLKLLICPWSTVSDIERHLDNDKIPIPDSVVELLEEYKWISTDYKHLWRHRNGDSAVLHVGEKLSFHLQTPSDGWPFCSFVLTERGESDTVGLYIADSTLALDSMLADQELDPELERLSQLSRSRNSFRPCFQGFMNLPLKILQKQGDDTRIRLSELQEQITRMEKRIASRPEKIDSVTENRILNEFNLEHLRMHRRWRFQVELGANLLRFFDPQSTMQLSHPSSQMYVRRMRDRVERSIRFADSFQYDFEIIPSRLGNLSKMIFNSVQLRDNQLNIQIAKSTYELTERSRQEAKLNLEISKSAATIAAEARRDSASMNIIAIVTLVFLPGTSIASFFSMTMFNWQPGGGSPMVTPYIWIYFAVTIPITAIILGVWRLSHHRIESQHRGQLLEMQAIIGSESDHIRL